MGTGLVNVDIGSIMSGAGTLLKDIRTAWTGKDPELEAKLVELQLQFDSARDSAQSAINLADASSGDKFNSRWRSSVAWVCVAAFFLDFFLFPLINYIAGFFGHQVPVPSFNVEELMTLLFGMLGLGTLRTVDKLNGTVK